MRDLRRWLRDQDVAAGRRTPRTMREIEIWRAGMAELDAQMEQLIARAEPERHTPGHDAGHDAMTSLSSHRYSTLTR